MKHRDDPTTRRERPSDKRGWTRSQRVRAILCLGIVPGLGVVSTQAAWTDQSTATSGTFTTGTLDIKLGNPAVDNDPAQFTADLAMANMAPGNSRDAGLRVTNGGSLPLTFTVSGAGVGAPDLAAALRVSVFPGMTNGVCSGTAIVSDVAASGPILGAQPVLPSADARDLCFRVTLPATADTSLQGKSSTLTLNFTATNA